MSRLNNYKQHKLEETEVQATTKLPERQVAPSTPDLRTARQINKINREHQRQMGVEAARSIPNPRKELSKQIESQPTTRPQDRMNLRERGAPRPQLRTISLRRRGGETPDHICMYMLVQYLLPRSTGTQGRAQTCDK